jgi:hypothetical protein
MPEQKTHWKKVVSDPNYIGEADFEQNEEKIVTIKRINSSETVTTAEGKSQKAVVHFAEPLKPMILNVARSKSIEKVAGSPYFEDWIGVKIVLYIEHGIKAFGDVVNAVRVRPYKPRVKQEDKLPSCADCGGVISPAAGKSAAYMVQYTTNKYGAPLCAACATKRKADQDAAKEQSSSVSENEADTTDLLPDEEEI